jgi:hypothetical protein
MAALPDTRPHVTHECTCYFRDYAAAGAMGVVGGRSVFWKLWLGCLPADSPMASWPAALAVHRLKYEELKKVHVISTRDVAVRIDADMCLLCCF